MMTPWMRAVLPWLTCVGGLPLSILLCTNRLRLSVFHWVRKAGKVSLSALLCVGGFGLFILVSIEELLLSGFLLISGVWFSVLHCLCINLGCLSRVCGLSVSRRCLRFFFSLAVLCFKSIGVRFYYIFMRYCLLCFGGIKGVGMRWRFRGRTGRVRSAVIGVCCTQTSVLRRQGIDSKQLRTGAVRGVVRET